MECNNKHNQETIEEGKKNFAELRELFIKRMTVDSDHYDSSQRDFNVAIFGYDDNGGTYANWCNIDMNMVLGCFDDAVSDWLES